MPDKYADPFEDPKLVLGRAEKHVQEFKAEVDSFIDKDAYRVTVEHDPEAGNYVHKVIVFGQPSANMKVVARDALGGLRSALDHLNSACMRIGGVESRSSENRFPFCEDEADFDRVIGIRSPQVARAVTDYWKTLRPYRTGNRSFYPLAAVRNSKEHWMLNPAILSVHGIIVQPHGHPAFFVNCRTGPGAEHHVELFRSPGPAAGYYDLQIVVHVGFQNPKAFGNVPILSILELNARRVRQIIEKTEAIYADLGLIKSAGLSGGV